MTEPAPDACICGLGRPVVDQKVRAATGVDVVRSSGLRVRRDGDAEFRPIPPGGLELVADDVNRPPVGAEELLAQPVAVLVGHPVADPERPSVGGVDRRIGAQVAQDCPVTSAWGSRGRGRLKRGGGIGVRSVEW